MLFWPLLAHDCAFQYLLSLLSVFSSFPSCHPSQATETGGVNLMVEGMLKGYGSLGVDSSSSGGGEYQNHNIYILKVLMLLTILSIIMYMYLSLVMFIAIT